MIMDSRYEVLQTVYNGFLHTGMSFIGLLDNSLKCFSKITSDHPGMYYFVPKIACFFHISLDQALLFFINGLLLMGFFLCMCGFYLLTRSFLFLGYGIVLAFGLWHQDIFYFFDVYVAYAVAICGVIPLFFYFFEKKYFSKGFCIFLFFAGILLGYCHLIRHYSLLPALKFIGLMLAWERYINLRKKIIFMGCLCFGLALPMVHIEYELYKSRIFLHQQIMQEIPVKKSFWHHIYIGFGFIPNYFSITYKDACAANKVKEIDSNVEYCSQKYEQILMKEVLNIIVHARLFVLSTLFAKLGICLLYFLLCFNFGLWGLWRMNGKKWMHGAFTIALLISATPGILVMPRSSYLSGFSMLSFVYGLYCLHFEWDILLSKIRRLFKNFLL